MASTPDPLQRSAIDRPLGWLIALGGCILVLDQTVFKIAATADFAPWWNAGALLVVAVLVLLAIAGLRLSTRILVPIWWTLPMLYWVLQATWCLGYRGMDIQSAVPWLWTVEPAVITLLLLVARPVISVGTGLVFALTPALTSLVVFGAVPQAIVLETPMQLGNVVYVAIFIGVRIQLERLHAGEAEELHQRQRQLRAAAGLEHHGALERLVHDEVLSVLSAAMHGEGRPSAVLCRHALRAIGALDLPTAEEPDPNTPIAGEEALAILTADLRRIDDRFALETRDGGGDIPRAILTAISQAAAEALRNSLRHAGEHASRRVRMAISGDGLSVSVSDDGVGFVPDPQSPRLGIARSIEGRMSDLGGSARIRSHSGQGTEVVLAWPM